MKIALVDDDLAQTQLLSKLISAELLSLHDMAHRLFVFHSGEEFLKSWKTGEYDLIVLDIFMNQLTGVDVARRIRETDENVRLAFCTSSNEFASESYEVNAQYYLQKPVTADSVHNLFKRLNLEVIALTQTVKLPDSHAVILRKILYTEYTNHIVTIYIKGEMPYRLRTSQADMEEILIPFGYFFSPVRGMIVNFHEVEKLAEDGFVLHDGTNIPVARRKYKEAKELYTKFRFNQMRKEVHR